MEYAIQLLLPILAGLLLGNWLHDRFGLSYLWTLALAILGMAGGIGVLYKRQMLGEQSLPKIDFKSSIPQKKSESGLKKGEPLHSDAPENRSLSHDELLELYKKADREPPTDDFALDDLLGDDDGEHPEIR